MRILQICHKPPRPAIDGGCIAMDNLTKGLLEAGHDVKILCASTHKHPFDPDSLSTEYLSLTDIEAVFIDTRMNFVDAFSTLITRDSYNISRFFTPDLDMIIERTLKKYKFDIVHVESLFMTPYLATIKRFSNAKVILRSHNLEYKIWQRMARATTGVTKRTVLQILAGRLKSYEISIMDQVDGIATISAEDETHYLSLGCNTPLMTIPFGIDTSEYIAESPIVFKPEFFHLGAMDWLPNIEGINWFLSEAWDKIIEDYPRLHLHLAGKASDGFKLGAQYANVHLDGEVPCAKDYMLNKGVMIVPLLSGGGIRVKIIEGMALGKVIISTSVGAEGLGVTHGKNILIADSGDEFKRRIDEIHENPSILEEISRNARNFVEQNFDNMVLTKKLVKFYEGKTFKTSELQSA